MNLSIIRDDSKLLDDSREVSKSYGVVGDSIFSREIIFLFDEKISHVVKCPLCSKTKL